MNKEEKLEQIYCLAQKLGLSRGEVVDYFSEKAGRCSTTQEIVPGMYVYADGLVSSEIIPNRQIKAVVGYVEEGMVYAVCLKQANLPWSSDCLSVSETRTMVNGKEATQKILKAARTQRQKAEAAKWCYNYAEDGVKPKEAFLASLYEWKKIFANRNEVNASLTRLGVAVLEGCYWSSTEYVSNHSWRLYLGSGGTNDYNKNCNYYVRPVIAFRI